MNYKIELTSKFKDKGQDRFFYLEKLNGSDWLPNEDLVNMITSIKLSECEEFFKSVISNEDFIFLEYSQIVLSDEGLLECQANNNNMVFSLFDDFYELPKPCFTQLVVDLINKLIENYWIAIKEDTVIGTIAILRIENKNSILKKMFVSKQHRGKEKGISTLLSLFIIR